MFAIRKIRGFWIGLTAVLLVGLVLCLQYLGSIYAIELTRISKEAELDRHLDDLGNLAVAMLKGPALSLDDLALDSLWEEQLRRQAGQTGSSAGEVYSASINKDLTDPIMDYVGHTRMKQLLVLSPEGRVLFDSLGNEPLLQTFNFWPIDRTETAAALAGKPASTPAYTAGSHAGYFKRTYVPVIENAESETTGGASGRRVGAVICLVAGDAYLDQEIGQLTLHLEKASFILTVLMALIGVFIYRLIRRQRRAELQAAENDRLAALGRLAAGFAHELRNPLGIIRAFTEDLQRSLQGAGETPEAMEACDDIIEEVDRMNRLVGQFLGYSRGRPAAPGSGRASALDAVESVMHILRPSAEKQGVTLRIEHAPAPRGEAIRWQARIEAGQLRQVLMNLLLNAIGISPRGGVIRVGLEIQPRRVRLTISDQGPGIGAQDRTRIFEPFYTTREGGSGLGLAISRQIANAAGGDLELGPNPPGGGAAFVLTLPRIGDAPAAPEGSASAASATPSEPFIETPVPSLSGAGRREHD